MVERNERETLEGGYDISLCLTILICTYMGGKNSTVTHTGESKFESILKNYIQICLHLSGNMLNPYFVFQSFCNFFLGGGRSKMTGLQKKLFINLTLYNVIAKYWIQYFYQPVFFRLGQVLYFFLEQTDHRPH